jgi:hypothetical protein
MKHSHWIVCLMLVVLAMTLTACGGEPAPTALPSPQPTQECPEAEPCPICPECEEPVVEDVPYETQWATSPHADASSLAFTYWDGNDPAEIPVACAKCHSGAGYLDFLGLDGTEAGMVNNPAPVGTVVTCLTCHNEATTAMTGVVFPSGMELDGLGDEARCMQCHQGRASTTQVNNSIENLGLTDDLDTPDPELGFINIHYYAAAATLYGAEAQGGYQYAGKQYDPKFEHVARYDTCISCHNPHTLELELDACSVCHTGVSTVEDLKDIRMAGSLVDFDGDGDVSQGLYYEIEGLQEMTMQAIQTYARDVSGKPIVYDSHAHPYFFIDTNDNSEIDPDEAAFANRYDAWTGRLLQAAFNYQVSKKDPGAYAHGGKYIIQLLYDSIEDLNSVISTPVDLTAANRDDTGHFNASSITFRYWDTQGAVPGTCARCHSGSGLPLFLQEGVNISAAPTSGLNCATCHDNVSTFTLYEVGAVTFPSGVSLDSGNAGSNMCLNCHQGRQSGVGVQAAITRAGVDDDTVTPALTFMNPHYAPAAGTLYGTEVKGAYEYAGNTYNERFTHVQMANTCVQCHDSHTLDVKVNNCSTCHMEVQTAEDLKLIRFSQIDFDGDGDVSEGLAGEIASMKAMLLEAIMDYAMDNPETDAIVYNPHGFPYFFIDTNENRVADPDETNMGNRYATWTPRLLRAAYNYQWVSKDPGAYAHNPMYTMQILYDSLQDIGADVSGMARPEVPED